MNTIAQQCGNGVRTINNTTQGGGFLGIGIDSAIIGAFIGVLGSLLVLGVRHQIRKRRLRKAIRAEIKIMADDIYRYAETLSGKSPGSIEIPPDSLVLTVYKNNASNIGLLSEDEVREITQFYALAESVKQRLSYLSESDTPPDYALRLLQRDLILLNNQKNTTILTIENKISGVELSDGSESPIYSDVTKPDYDVVDYLDDREESDTE